MIFVTKSASVRLLRVS